MKIGCLGDIAFRVSDEEIKTLRDASLSGSASIQNHQRHLKPALQEFVGSDSDQFEFKIRLSAFLGADPMTDFKKIEEYCRNGITLPLTIGKTTFGRYRWLIKKYKSTFEHYDKTGNIVGMDVTVTLTEYVKE